MPTISNVFFLFLRCGGETLKICQSTIVQWKHSQIDINLAELPGEKCQAASHLEPELKARPAQTTGEKMEGEGLLRKL